MSDIDDRLIMLSSDFDCESLDHFAQAQYPPPNRPTLAQYELAIEQNASYGHYSYTPDRPAPVLGVLVENERAPFGRHSEFNTSE